MTEEQFRALVLGRFGAMAELERHLLRVERQFRKLLRHPERIEETDGLDELLDEDDEEDED